MLIFFVMWGVLPTYIAGVTTSFRSATIFIVLKRHPYINLIFKSGEEPPHNFFRPFAFTLNADGTDVCRFDVTDGDFGLRITFVGVIAPFRADVRRTSNS
jgi:hypothetical protein